MRTLFFSFFMITLPLSYAAAPATCDPNFVPYCDRKMCCNDMGGVSYCDSSAGRYVCNNGYYSTCYCTRHAVMDMQKFEGCCLWQGGVLTISSTGIVICNNGGASEICTIQNPPQPTSIF